MSNFSTWKPEKGKTAIWLPSQCSFAVVRGSEGLFSIVDRDNLETFPRAWEEQGDAEAELIGACRTDHNGHNL